MLTDSREFNDSIYGEDIRKVIEKYYPDRIMQVSDNHEFGGRSKLYAFKSDGNGGANYYAGSLEAGTDYTLNNLVLHKSKNISKFDDQINIGTAGFHGNDNLVYSSDKNNQSNSSTFVDRDPGALTIACMDTQIFENLAVNRQVDIAKTLRARDDVKIYSTLSVHGNTICLIMFNRNR